MTMALESVFANDLQFGEVDPNQAQDDERDEEEEEEEDADLEEGEIADDDDDVVQEEEMKADKIAPDNNGDKKDNKKEDNGKSITERSDNHSNSNSNLTAKCNSNANSADKRRERSDKRSTRNRKRASDDELPDHRDSNRKRRRAQDDVKDDLLLDEPDFEMMNVRGHSPDPLSDYEQTENSSTTTGNSNNRRQRGADRARGPTARASSPPARRRNRESRPDRQDRQDRRRNDRQDRQDRRPATKNSSNSASLAAKIKDESICAFYMEGKCSRGGDCPYSHAALPPRKMELCKFYLMDCCAKKDKCLYLHKDFPCKFFHTGKKCRNSADDCKFSHEPLSETTRAILIKHIETAPREILGDFPRLTREETIQAIDNFSPQPNGREKRPHIPSLFEGSAAASASGNKSENSSTGKDHGSKIQVHVDAESPSSNRRIGFYQETVENATAPAAAAAAAAAESAERSPEESNSRSIWFGQLRQENKDRQDSSMTNKSNDSAALDKAPIADPVDYLSTLPARQRQLYLRIQQQQREPASSSVKMEPVHQDDEKPRKLGGGWYSSDDEDHKGKSMSDLIKNIRPLAADGTESSQAESSRPGAADLNLSSLDNINVADIAKALSTLKQESSSVPEDGHSGAEGGRRDPRMRDPRMRSQAPPINMGDVDHRLAPPGSGRQDVDLRVPNRMNVGDTDLRSGLTPLGSLDDIGSSDIDLRRLVLPFKSSAPVYSTAAAVESSREIEASVTCRPPMEYKVYVVDYIPLDYSIIRVHADWSHLDPRQQKSHATVRDFTSSDPPSIPLGPSIPAGPASPDPPAPESSAYAASAPNRSAPNDPRARDPRRAAAAERQADRSSPGGSIPDPWGKPGLLGAAPPGMVPFKGKTESVPDAPYSPYAGGGAQDQQHATPLTENRRDPRQRLRNLSTTPEAVRSYTPPPNERGFR